MRPVERRDLVMRGRRDLVAGWCGIHPAQFARVPDEVFLAVYGRLVVPPPVAVTSAPEQPGSPGEAGRSWTEDKARFLDDASQGLRAPLAVVRGYLELMQRGALGSLTPQLQELLPSLIGRLDDMALFIHGLLEATWSPERTADRRRLLGDAPPPG